MKELGATIQYNNHDKTSVTITYNGIKKTWNDISTGKIKESKLISMFNITSPTLNNISSSANQTTGDDKKVNYIDYMKKLGATIQYNNAEKTSVTITYNGINKTWNNITTGKLSEARLIELFHLDSAGSAGSGSTGSVAGSVRMTEANGTTYANHGNSLDFAASKGTPIASATSGKVIEVNWGYADNYAVRPFDITVNGIKKTVYYEVDANGNIKKENNKPIIGQPYGNSVKIQTDDGAILIYGHMAYSENAPVKKNTDVEAGQQIGSVGNTGNSHGNHLHFEARNTTKPVTDYLPE